MFINIWCDLQQAIFLIALKCTGAYGGWSILMEECTLDMMYNQLMDPYKVNECFREK